MPTSVSDIMCMPDMSLPVACLGKGPPTASHGREAAWLHQNPAVSSTQTQSGLQSGPCIWSPRHKPHTEVLPVLFNCVALSVPILLMQLKLMPPGNCPGGVCHSKHCTPFPPRRLPVRFSFMGSEGTCRRHRKERQPRPSCL